MNDIQQHKARAAARALREVLATNWATAGVPSTMHLLLARPRRGVWLTTWPSLPGLSCSNGEYRHELLPRWSYTLAEVTTEMLPDLERLAETGEQPTEATR